MRYWQLLLIVFCILYSNNAFSHGERFIYRDSASWQDASEVRVLNNSVVYNIGDVAISSPVCLKSSGFICITPNNYYYVPFSIPLQITKKSYTWELNGIKYVIQNPSFIPFAGNDDVIVISAEDFTGQSSYVFYFSLKNGLLGYSSWSQKLFHPPKLSLIDGDTGLFHGQITESDINFDETPIE